jgi:hypothetical protein
MAQYQNIVPNQLGQAAITASTTTLYTVPAGTRTFLKELNIANTTTGVIAVTVYLVPNGGTAGAGNVLLPAIPMQGNSVLQWTGAQVLLPGSTIQILASALGATITASGGEAT